MDFAPYSDGLAWGSDDGTLRTVALRAGWQFAPSARLQEAVPQPISAHARMITDLEYLAKERILTCSEDGSIKLWNMLETDSTMPLDLPDVPAHGLAFAPYGEQVAVPCEDGRIWLGRAIDGRKSDSVRIGEHVLDKLVFLPDGSRIVVGDHEGTLRVWDRRARRVVAEWHNPQPARIWGLAVAPEGGHVASAAVDQLLRIHDAESLSVVETISAPANVFALDFSPDGRVLAWGGAFSDLFLHETGAWAQIRRIPTRSACHCIAFANDEGFLASGHDNGSIQIIDPSTGRVVERLESGASVMSLAWSPDDRLLVSVHRDGTQRVWHVPSATELGILHRGGVSGTTQFSPDGTRLAAISRMNDDRSQGILWKLDD